METLKWLTIIGDTPFHTARSIKTRSKPVLYHGHDFSEIFWVDAGHGTHQINGHAIPLQRGSLILIRPTDCHGISTSNQEGIEITNIAFDRKTLDALGARHSRNNGWAFWQRGEFPLSLQIEPGQLRRFNHWADELSQAPREHLHIERFLLNILAELSLKHMSPMLENTPDWLAQACMKIQKQDQFSGGVVRFLHLCGRSREHVARSMRHYFGMTPTDYVNTVRMAYARRQLEMGDQDILTIALDCGIENLSHFYTLFRQATQMTPRAYRLAHQKSL